MPRILITPIELHATRGPAHEVLEQAGFEIVIPQPGSSMRNPEHLIVHLQGVDGVLASVEPYDRTVLSASRLRCIARAGVGYDSVDVPTATEFDVAVTITPGTNHDSVSEHALALLLGVFRGFPYRDQQVRKGDWKRKTLPRLMGRTIGLVGMGRIGKAMIPRCLGLGLKVVVADPFADQQFIAEQGVELVTFDELLTKADVVSLHCPVTAETTNLINAKTLARMKPGVVIINTARGALVDEDALVDALRSGHVAAAGLDAFQVEPLPLTSPLLSCENVLLTPHNAGIDEESLIAMTRNAAQCLVDLYQGRNPEGCVVNGAQLFPGWRWETIRGRK